MQKKFFDTELGKIAFHVIHENNGAMGLINNNIHILKTLIELGELTDEKLTDVLNVMKNCVERTNAATDFLYVKTKEFHENNLQSSE